MYNATSVKEATKSTQLNHYILVFTIVTIFYLPLNFVVVSHVVSKDRAFFIAALTITLTGIVRNGLVQMERPRPNQVLRSRNHIGGRKHVRIFGLFDMVYKKTCPLGKFQVNCFRFAFRDPCWVASWESDGRQRRR